LKNQLFTFNSKIKGTLNDLYFTNLNLKDLNNSSIIGYFNLKNALKELINLIKDKTE
jgi:hypothetical protein